MKKLIFLSFILLATSCTNSFFEDGEVLVMSYTDTIPFEDRQGLIVVTASINDVPYDFLFDSGAITIFSEEVGNAIGFTTEFTENFTDSQERSFAIDFGHLKQLRIGELEYANIAAGVTDFTAINAITCLNIDGIIGSNIMQKSIWQVDYESMELTVTDNISELDIASNASQMKIKTDDKGQAFVDVTIGNEKLSKIEIDLGSRAAFTLTTDFYNELVKSQNYNTVDGSGYGSAGFTGYSDATEAVQYIKVDELKINDEIFAEQIVGFDVRDTPSIGNPFLRNYRVIIDWLGKNLYLNPVGQSKVQLENYGIEPIYNNGQPLVGFIFNDISSEIDKLDPNDRILSIDGIDCSNIGKEAWCTLFENLIQEQKPMIDINVIRDGVMISASLEWTQLL